ncbi:hypothetical protein DPMN_109466 [Dreissena polymorpha]|uniref:VWFA domain-containing protein n=1 Tax=Dreissena polymorpha TaxID=45954 RepID=A0A9D4KB33_DREPO|nr:hypothetical protein DPMN_109466 [Dreissena polymorpha]
METELNDLQTATQAWGFNRRRQKNKNQSNVAGCALVGANGFIEPTGAESNEFEESKSDNARITISRNTFRAKDSMTTETNYNNGAEEYHSTAGLSTSDSDVGYEPGQTTQTEPHLIQQSEPKSEPIMSRNTENKNSHGDVDDHSSANENENDSQGKQPESVPTSNSFAAGYTRTEPLPEKAPPKISKPNFVVSSSRDKSYINLNKFIVSSFGNQPSTPQKPRAYSNVSSRYLSETNVIRQTEKSYLPGDETAWQSLSMMARNRARQRGAAVNEDCVISILCLDISESMAGDAWNQVKTFTKDFLEGLTESKASAPHIRDEYVGVATFGHKTELSVLLTKNFEEVGRHIDGISLGGPTPLYGGLMMALAGAMSSDNEIGPCINGIRAFPKIIVLTDGYPTELMLNAGPDVADESEIEQA